MTLSDLWQSLSPEALNLLLGLAGKIAEGLIKKAAHLLGLALRGTPEEQGLRECLTTALAEFLACLDLPEDSDERKDWVAHLENLLTTDDVQKALIRAVLHEGRPEAVDLAPFRQALDEATLPWREGQSLEKAARAFACAFEREAEARPQFQAFLVATRLKRVADQLERGVPVEGMEALLAALERIAEGQAALERIAEGQAALKRIAEGQAALFTYLARMGYSVRVEGSVAGSIVVTVNNNQVILTDDSLLARLFRALPNPDRALTEYRAHIRRTCERLPLEGLALPEIHGRPLDPDRLRIPLDRVYIKLRALPYRERREGTPPPEDPGAAAHYIRERQEEYRRGKTFAFLKGEVVPPEEAVEKHLQLVLLGAPGAGKSTFLRYLARAWAAGTESLPLLVPLGRADAAMAGGRSLLEAALDHLTAHKAGVERETLREALEREIARKRVRWLWDGLDEVRLHRQEVVKGLADLAADGHRMVVTSRPLGYEPIAGCDALYEVLPLLQEDAEAFVDRWFRALAWAQDVPEKEQERWAAKRAAWLRRQLATQPGLREVARNPLLLTFLAVLAGDEPRRELPRTRKDLYTLYVERLLTTWEARRSDGKGPLLEGVTDLHEARELLLWGFRRAALHLHRAYGEVPQRATRPAVQESLAEALAQEVGLSRFQARARAGAILEFWERAGLLDRYPLGGQDWLAFRHLTFQEYGAAWALAEIHRDDPEGLWAELKPHLLEKEWAKVISLALALYEKDVTCLVERLLEANQRDFRQQRPLFLAAAALAKGAPVRETTRQTILNDLTLLARTRKIVWPFFGKGTAAGNAIRALARLNAAERLKELAQSPDVDAWVRIEAAEALFRLDRADEAADLLQALGRDERVEAWARLEAAEALFRLDRADEAADLLRALAQDERADGRVRVEAAEVLGHRGCGKEAAEILRNLAQDKSLGRQGQEHIVHALQHIRRAEDLLALAQDESIYPDIRAAAKKALKEMGYPLRK